MAELQNGRKGRIKITRLLAFLSCNPAILQFCKAQTGFLKRISLRLFFSRNESDTRSDEKSRMI